MKHSPWEYEQCEHGVTYRYRWEWADDSDIESSHPIKEAPRCAECNPLDPLCAGIVEQGQHFLHDGWCRVCGGYKPEAKAPAKAVL